MEKLKVYRYGVDWKSFLFAGLLKTLRHEGNNLGGGKTIHVVYRLRFKGAGGRNNTTLFSYDPWIFQDDDVSGILILGVGVVLGYIRKRCQLPGIT